MSFGLTRNIDSSIWLNIIQAQTPNSMGRNTWAGKLQALLLWNCTLRYLVLMAVAQMKTSMANAVRSKSGPGALCVGPRRSLCQGPTLSVGGRRSLPGPALSLQGPALPALCVGARQRRARRSLCRRFPCRARRSLCQGPELSGCSLCRCSRQIAGHRQRAPGVDARPPVPAQALTQKAPGPDRQSAGARRRARAPTQRALGERLPRRAKQRLSGRQRERWEKTAGPRHRPRQRAPEPLRAPETDSARHRECRAPTQTPTESAGPGALFVGPRLSLCRGPALPVSRAPCSDLRSACHPSGVVGVPGRSISRMSSIVSSSNTASLSSSRTRAATRREC